MMDDHMDDLDRALAALPLEEPPRDLCARILARTIYRPVPVFSALEIWLVVVIGSVALWLAGLVLADSHALAARSGIVGEFLAANAAFVLAPGTIMWAAVGTGVALWIIFFQTTRLRRTVRS
jgi:hypothetical protein